MGCKYHADVPSLLVLGAKFWAQFLVLTPGMGHHRTSQGGNLTVSKDFLSTIPWDLHNNVYEAEMSVFQVGNLASRRQDSGTRGGRALAKLSDMWIAWAEILPLS